MPAAVKIEGLNLAYHWSDFTRIIFKDVELDLPVGSFATVTGSNGSGKSSLLRLILGLCVPQSGRISIHGNDVTAGSPATLKSLNAAYLPQNPTDLFLGETVRQELLTAVDGNDQRVTRIAADFALTRHLEQPIRHLSGGERQRLGLASFFAQDRQLLFLDEPSSYLDYSSASLLKDALQQASREGATILHVTQYDDEIKWGQIHFHIQDSGVTVRT